MKRIRVKDILGWDSISKGNEKAWGTIYEAVKDETEDLMLDFDDIEVKEPCSSANFRLLMGLSTVNITIYKSEGLAKSIEMMCKLMKRWHEGKVKNDKGQIYQAPKSKAEIQIEQRKRRWANLVQVDEDQVGRLYLAKEIDQLGSADSVINIFGGIDLVHTEQGLNNFVLELGDITVNPSIAEHIVSWVCNFKDKGVWVEFHSDLEYVRNSLEVAIQRQIKNFSVEQKLSIMRRIVNVGKVGLLQNYKPKPASEDNSFGAGDLISCSIAVFRGVKKDKEGKVKAVFEVYQYERNSDDGDEKELVFSTRQHWSITHDNEKKRTLDCVTREVPVDELGMYDEFMGSTYYFAAPVTLKKEHMVKMFDYNDEGRAVYEEFTYPELIMRVFDDFGIEYDHEYLRRCAEGNRKYLEAYVA